MLLRGISIINIFRKAKKRCICVYFTKFFLADITNCFEKDYYGINTVVL